uniref:Thioredoxin H-type n=1 Tax=Anthurium amnicola TaxID=1678845 RepID=A0A1D1XI24_9ARAE
MASQCAVPPSMGYDEFLSRASCEVIVCHSDRDFDGFMTMATGKPGSDVVVVDFYAEWCAPCRQMDPFLQDWVKKLPGVIFLKVNIEKAKVINDLNTCTIVNYDGTNVIPSSIYLNHINWTQGVKINSESLVPLDLKENVVFKM